MKARPNSSQEPLVIEDIRDDFDHANSMLMLRLLTQIAVEIFQRETDTQLNFNTIYNQRYVLLSGGFSGGMAEDDTEELAKVAEARANNDLFPDNEDLGGRIVSISKLPIEQEGTHLVSKKRNKDRQRIINPALVDFELGVAPITWEAQIQKKPLLNGTGPILPKYMWRDLSKYEILSPIKK
jgi:hypothetical protein